MGNQYFELRFSAEWKYGHGCQTDTGILNWDLVPNENIPNGTKTQPGILNRDLVLNENTAIGAKRIWDFKSRFSAE